MLSIKTNAVAPTSAGSLEVMGGVPRDVWRRRLLLLSNPRCEICMKNGPLPVDMDGLQESCGSLCSGGGKNGRIGCIGSKVRAVAAMLLASSFHSPCPCPRYDK